MGLKKILKRSSKAQLMTIIMLVLFMLMMAELFTLALLNITSDETMQSFSISFASSNYGNLLRLSANNFAKESLSRAISSLATYEYNPSLRKRNFISNTTLYISNMIVSGILPNDTSGYPQNAMGNLTLANYNKSIASLFNFAAQSFTVNESTPIIFQPDPYHIGVSYIERISINSSGNNYKYNIPVNVSISINNTPDLLYAQQGIQRNIKFANFTNMTSLIGGAYATSGNAVAYAYGTVYNMPSSSVTSLTCPFSIPARFAPMSQNIIIVTYNAMDLGSCINNYVGLISYIAPSSLPTVPYLAYPVSTNALQSLPDGQKVLLYGPGFKTLNIEGLRTAIMNGYYFSSPFTPSYFDMAQGISRPSPNGIFTFSNYNTQSANFNSLSSSYIQMTDPIILQANTGTVSAWINTANAGTGFAGIVVKQYAYGIFLDSNQYILYDWDGGSWSERSTGISLNDGKWHFVAATFQNSITGGTILYIDGVNVLATTMTINSQSSPLEIGAGSSGPVQTFNGLIADVQIYNNTLTPSQINMLYRQGISGTPLSSNLIGWWPLNGDVNDYSGFSNNGIATAISYSLLPNYNRESIFNIPTLSSLSPIPGVLSCSSNAQCSSNLLPHLFLGVNPLEMQNAYLQTASFSGHNGYYIQMTNPAVLQVNTGTVSAWINTFNAGSSWAGILVKYAAYGIFLDNNQFAIFDWQAFAPTIANINLNDGKWHFVAATFQSGVAGGTTLYIDGVSKATNAMTVLNQNYPVEIGAGDNTGIQPFNGLIADAQIYSNVLTPTQISTLYRQGISSIPISSNLIGWWPLDGDANDYSGFANNGIPKNMIYPYFSGTYNAPGLSSVAASVNEWQALGITNT